MEIKTLDFLVLCGFVSLVAMVVANVFLPWVLALVVAGVCLRGCWAWVEYQREKRRERFIAQLPEVARLLSNASSAGLAVRRSIEMAAAELDEPAATEMSLIAEELRLGQNVEQALRHLEERMPSREVGVLISTLVIQQRAGGDLVHALQELASALDARRDLIREVRTVMSGSVFTSYMVAGIGIFMLFLINSMSPGAFDKMLGSPWGIAALVLSGALYSLGFMLIRRTTRIEV
jgi:tight adherence protein B